MAPFVIDEIKVIGSRCDPFSEALRLMKEAVPPLDLHKYVSATFPLEDLKEAIRKAKESSSLKVQIQIV